jgi:hypothetical protein
MEAASMKRKERRLVGARVLLGPIIPIERVVNT